MDGMTRVGATGWRVAAWTGAALLWLAPAVAIRFTPEVRWDASDFTVFGAMLLTALAAFEACVRHGGAAYRLGAAVTIGAGFLMLWATLGAGIIGSERDPANLMYPAVLAIGATGVAIARWRPGGMARAALAMPAATIVAGLAALAGLHQAIDPRWPWDVIGATIAFATVWTIAAGLFRHAARGDRATGR